MENGRIKDPHWVKRGVLAISIVSLIMVLLASSILLSREYLPASVSGNDAFGLVLLFLFSGLGAVAFYIFEPRPRAPID